MLQTVCFRPFTGTKRANLVVYGWYMKLILLTVITLQLLLHQFMRSNDFTQILIGKSFQSKPLL